MEENNLQNFHQKKWIYFYIMDELEALIYISGFQIKWFIYPVQKFFHIRPYFVSRTVQAKQKWLKWTILQES